MKHFNPNHYGYPSLKQAHKTMAKIADHINKVKKREENEKRVKHLQTSLYGWKGNDVRREREREREGGEREKERERGEREIVYFPPIGSRQSQCVWRATIRSKFY